MHRRLLIVLSISIFLNVIFVIPYWSIYYSLFEKKMGLIDYYDSSSANDVIINSIVKQSLSEGDGGYVYNDPQGLLHDVKSFFIKRNKAPYINFYPEAYKLVGLSYYSLCRSDTILRNSLIEKSRSYIDNQGKFKYTIEVCDQVPIGIFFINLYKQTKLLRFKRAYEEVYSRLLGMRVEGDFIPYSNQSGVQLNDVLGMTIPFLMEYYSISKDSLAKEIAYYNFKNFYLYGVDKETGIPAHGYNYYKKIKVGSINWGRGIGWYALAASYLPHFRDSLFDLSLNRLDYTQFPGSSKKTDTSVALMIEIYKQSRNPNRPKKLDFIKSFIRKDGDIDSVSGDTHGLNNYNRFFGTSALADGLLLMLISKWYAN